MNWSYLKPFPWLDRRASFVAAIPHGGVLLDLGTAEGETLRHIAELRPDLKLIATDIAGVPRGYPEGSVFHQVNLETDPLPVADASVDAVTSFHLVEHLREVLPLMHQVKRVLRPGGAAFFETPHPRSLTIGSVNGRMTGRFTMNFYDDLTHVRLVPTGALAQLAVQSGLEVCRTGVSRNWLFAASWPFFWFMPASRQKLTARLHWLGWSAFLEARRPGET